ncbi:MAG: SPOR domain-containing protein [Spirochaetota bacterium]
MEHSKTLIVIVSVSLFVAVVLGLGLVLFYPREAPEVAGAGGQAGSAGGFDAIEYLRDPDAEQPSLEAEEDEDEDSEEEDDVIIVYGEAVEERPDEDRADEDRREPGERDSSGERDTSGEGADGTEAAPAEREPAPEAERPAERAQEPETAQPARTAPQRAPESRTREEQVTEYWIQVIATTSRDRVEMAHERLREHELSGRITTKVVDGRTFYRLRVGPYTNKSEAAKFLDWVVDIEGFADSYISEEYRTRTVRG